MKVKLWLMDSWPRLSIYTPRASNGRLAAADEMIGDEAGVENTGAKK